MIFENPTEEIFERYFKEFDTTKERLEQDAQTLKDWFFAQPHLPQCLKDDVIFRKILMLCKFSMERSKQTLDLHFTLKSSLPEFYSERDPLSPRLQSIMKICYAVTLPRVTREGYRVTFYRINDKDATNFNIYDVCKLILMIADTRFIICKELNLGQIIVCDYANAGIGHLSHMTLPLIKKAEICITKGYRMPIKGIHFINPPPIMGRVLSLFKSVLKSKISSRMFVHSSLESLHQHVDRRVLPADYGGEDKKLSEIAADWKEELVSHRDWFLDHEVTGRVDESKRPGKSVDTNKLFGIEGSFKKLTVD